MEGKTKKLIKILGLCTLSISFLTLTPAWAQEEEAADEDFEYEDANSRAQVFAQDIERAPVPDTSSSRAPAMGSSGGSKTPIKFKRVPVRENTSPAKAHKSPTKPSIY